MENGKKFATLTEDGLRLVAAVDNRGLQFFHESYIPFGKRQIFHEPVQTGFEPVWKHLNRFGFQARLFELVHILDQQERTDSAFEPDHNRIRWTRPNFFISSRSLNPTQCPHSPVTTPLLLTAGEEMASVLSSTV